MKMLINVARAISTSGLVVCVLIIAFFMFSTVADAILRYIFNQPLKSVFELNGLLMAVLIFMGLATTQRVRGHLNVTLLVARFESKSKIGGEVLSILSLLLCFAFVMFMGYQTWLGALYSLSIREYHWGITEYRMPIWWAKFALPIGLWMFSLEYIVELGNTVARLIGRTTREGTRELGNQQIW